ncbi:hypothetical protein OGZ02_15645 [Brachyspira hyodysenteriae]|nr:hypothetical protein [Brachyspira hyodysenteriae]MDA1470215.1 hypothetical protein [Brachyspira hyodysenteriae]
MGVKEKVLQNNDNIKVSDVSRLKWENILNLPKKDFYVQYI